MKMPRKKKAEVRILKVPKNASLRQIYKIARESFTAADLQKYTEVEEGVPMERILAEMEEIQRKTDVRTKKKETQGVSNGGSRETGKRAGAWHVRTEGEITEDPIAGTMYRIRHRKRP